MTNQSIWFQIISDLSVNMAAGWLATIITIPNFVKATKRYTFIVLTGDILGVIVSLLIAYYFRIQL